MSSEVIRVRAGAAAGRHSRMGEARTRSDDPTRPVSDDHGATPHTGAVARAGLPAIRRGHTRSLFWRLALVNVSVLVAVALLLALAPVTISVPVRPTELLIIALGLLVTTATSVLLVRRTLGPLQQLTEVMRSVDPMEPGRRLTDVDVSSSEVAALTESFNAMLDRLEFERRESARRALTAQEHERLRIARELHDEIGQTLTAIALEAERAAEGGSGLDRESWQRVADWGQQSVEDLRRIARELRPEALDDLGLINAFIALCNRVAAQGDLEITRRLPDRLPPHDPDIDLVVYRVAQEALTNVMRHSGAARATVTLEVRGSHLHAAVTDDGHGIEEGERGDSKTGLAGMRERAMLAGGALTIRSGPGKGTSVELEVPLQP
jgi:two-component system sensor histidine kinase UhpB